MQQLYLYQAPTKSPSYRHSLSQEVDENKQKPPGRAGGEREVTMRPRTRNLNIPSDQEILALEIPSTQPAVVLVEPAARYLGSSTATLYEALQDERVPFGWAVQHNSHWSYNISPGALVRYKREGLPMYRLKDVSEIICEDVNRLIDQRMSLVGKLTSVLLET